MESLASEGLTAMFHQLDINDGKSITTAAAYFKEKYGGVDVLVNNAAIAFKSMLSWGHFWECMGLKSAGINPFCFLSGRHSSVSCPGRGNPED